MQNRANAQRAEQEELLAQDVESKRKVAAALQQAYRRKRQLECDINDCSGEIERIKGEQSGFKMQQTVEAANAAMESIENLLHEGEVLKSKDALLVALVPSRTSAPAGGIFETRIETVKAAKMALDVVIASIPEGTKHGEQVLNAACRALHRYYFGDDMSPYFGFTIFTQNLSTRLITSGEYSYLLHTAGRRVSWANAAARLVMAETPAGLVGDVFDLPVAGHLEDSWSSGGSGGGSSGGGSGGIGGGNGIGGIGGGSGISGSGGSSSIGGIGGGSGFISGSEDITS
jgi:hypothetical protein